MLGTSQAARGVTREAYTLLSSVSGHDSAAASGLGVAPVGERRKGSVGYRVGSIGQILTLDANAGVETLDGASYLVRDRRGNERPLAPGGATASRTAGLRATVLKGAGGATLGGAKNIDDSPLATTQADVAAHYGFFEQTTTLTAAYAYLEQKQPESYFVDRDYKTKARPELVHAAQSTLTLEQVLTERLKAAGEIFTGQRREERPVYVGGALNATYAATDRAFVRGQARLIQERRADALQNERGYFALRSLKAELTVEPLYDWLLSLSLGVLREQEDDPRVALSSSLLSRMYGLGTRLSAGAAQVDLRGAYQISDAGATRVAFEGGLTWKL